MWYKIEVGDDGGILSCAEVEASVAQGKHVRYVEADSRADAIKLVQQWWRQKEQARAYRAKIAATCKTERVCIYCKKNEAVGRSVCRECIAKQGERRKVERERDRIRRASGVVPPMSKPLTDADRVAQVLKRNARAREYAKRVKTIAGGATPKTAAHRALSRALAHFDQTTPRAFRAWLVAEIARVAPARDRTPLTLRIKRAATPAAAE